MLPKWKERKSIALAFMRDVQGSASRKLTMLEKVGAAAGFAKGPADLAEPECCASSRQWRSVMRDWSARSRTPIGLAIAGILAVVLVVFAGSVRAQDAPRVGLKIRTLTAELRKQHKVAEDVKGALVTAVTAGSPAQEKGIVAGDVIVEAGGKPVDAAPAVAKSIKAASAAGSISFKLVNSKGERRDVIVPLPKQGPIVPGPK
jgi:PDZ domain